MGWGGYGGYGYAPYVSVAQKLAKGKKHAAQVAKKQGRDPSPVKLDGKKIATTFWGKAWCDNLDAYSDYSNRLPRGATYVRNGSVVDLVIKPRLVEAVVAGSEAYTIHIKIGALAKPTWSKIKNDCSASIDSLLDLLAGRLSDGVMQRLTRQNEGLFPSPREIQMDCSCPDSAGVCKHLAAVMYGIGARLDKQPELLFVLRDVDHQELASQAVAAGNLEKELSAGIDASLAGQDLGAIFGIELDATSPPVQKPGALPASPRAKATRTSKSTSTATAKKAARKPKIAIEPKAITVAIGKRGKQIAAGTRSNPTGSKPATSKSKSKLAAPKVSAEVTPVMSAAQAPTTKAKKSIATRKIELKPKVAAQKSDAKANLRKRAARKSA